MDRPAIARITVVKGRKLTLPTSAMICSEYGSTPGQPAVMASTDSTNTAGSRDHAQQQVGQHHQRQDDEHARQRVRIGTL